MNVQEIEKFTELKTQALITFADKVSVISSGSLALTITFKNSITTGSDQIFLLKTSWICFAVATTFATLMHLMSALLYGKMLREITREVDYPNANAGPLFTVVYIIMYLGFIGGIAALVAFASFNLK